MLSWEEKEGAKTKLEKQLNEKVTFVKDAPTAFVVKSGENVFGAYGEKFSQLIRRRRYNGRIESFENDQRFLSGKNFLKLPNKIMVKFSNWCVLN